MESEVTNNLESLILENLRAICGSIDKLQETCSETRLRVSSLESHVAGLRRDVGLIHRDIAGTQVRIDHLDNRLSRIEKQLEPTTI